MLPLVFSSVYECATSFGSGLRFDIQVSSRQARIMQFEIKVNERQQYCKRAYPSPFVLAVLVERRRNKLSLDSFTFERTLKSDKSRFLLKVLSFFIAYVFSTG